MKITKSQLKQIIKEELNEAHGGALGPFPGRYGDAHKRTTDSPPTEGGQWPGSSASLQALAPLSDAIANDLGVDLYEANIGERLVEIVLKEFYQQ